MLRQLQMLSIVKWRQTKWYIYTCI